MKNKLKKVNLRTLAIILVILTSLCSGLLIGYLIPKNIPDMYYVQTSPVGQLVVSGYYSDNYTVEEIEIIVWDSLESVYSMNTYILSCNFSTILFVCASVQVITASPYFIQHAHRYANGSLVDDSLHTSVSLKNWSNNYFSIQVTFWKLIVK